MPFEEQQIPPNTRCINDRCHHMYQTHDEDGMCDLCACDEFQPPAGLLPKFVPDPEKQGIYNWICRDCFMFVYPGRHKPPLDSPVLVKCVRCGEMKKCSRASDVYLETAK